MQPYFIFLRLALATACFTQLAAQSAPPLAVAPPSVIEASLTRALTGDWAGVIEYPGPNESDLADRVRVATWLAMTGNAGHLSFRFTYDEDPGPISTHTLAIGIDVAASTLSITNPRGRKEIYRVEGYDSLHDGYGDLLLLGPFVDVHRPVGTHITLSIHRNSFTWYEENRPTPAVPFAFRHKYSFTRVQPPVPAPASSANPIH